MSSGTVQIRLPEPHDAQKIVQRQAKRYNVVCCGRRWGKTVWGEDRCIHPMLQGKPTGWFAPSYKYVQEVFRDFNDKLRPIITQSNAQEKRIEIETGGSIEFWSLDRDDDAGRSRAYECVVVDEAAKIRTLETAWNEAIRATLADYGGTAWFTSTPKGKNFFHRLYQRGETEEEWMSWQMPTWTNSHIDEAEIEAMRYEMPERVFKQEVEAQFIDAISGGYFDRTDIEIVSRADLPSDLDASRHWDLAGTRPTNENPDPDFSCGTKIAPLPDGRHAVLDARMFREGPAENERRVRNTASQDGQGVRIWIEQEPGQSGKSQVQHYARNVLQGYTVRGHKPTGDKATRAQGPSAASERGDLVMVRGDWTTQVLDQLHSFPAEGVHDDAVDTISQYWDVRVAGEQEPGFVIA
jgi:predicted phage terminase large subunit-like protein